MRTVTVAESGYRELLTELQVMRRQRDELQARMSEMVVERQSGYAKAKKDAYSAAVGEAAVVVEESKDLFEAVDTSDGFTSEEGNAHDRATLAKRIRDLANER